MVQQGMSDRSEPVATTGDESGGATTEVHMSEVARTVSIAKGEGRKSVHELLESHDFKALVAKRWSVSMILLVLLFVGYYGFILLIGSNKELMSTKVGEVTTLGIPLGVGVIVFAWILTAFYVGWANKSYDPEVDRLKGQLKH